MMTQDTIKRQDFSHIHRDLMQWYQCYGRRDLPWRCTTDSYAIYISEIMLQQTQVQTVLARFYTPFLHRFPSLQALADADEQDVLHQWQGLGYYSRARNLHRAAKLAAPRLPDTVEALMQLPGIGRNTAHAVAAFAFRRSVPVLEANVKRVVARFFALTEPTEAEWWAAASALMGQAEPFDYNQAMMDMGALVCRPRQPLCDECPLAAGCSGKNNPEHYPAAKQKKAIPTRQVVWLAVERQEDATWFLAPRSSRFLGGLYRLPELPAHHPATVWLQSHPGAIHKGEIRQSYSHFHLQASVWWLPEHWLHAMSDDIVIPWRQQLQVARGRWVSHKNWEDIPTSGADDKAMLLLMAG